MRALARCYSNASVVKALESKARSIERTLGIISPVDNTLWTFHALVGNKPPEDLPLDEAEKTLAHLYSTMTMPKSSPPQPVDLSDRYRSLLDSLLFILPEVRSSEQGASHPLNTICLLSSISQCYAKVGDLERARETKKDEMTIIASSWGEGHLLMVDAVKEYNALSPGDELT
jgi:hypothetical protein